MLPDVIIANLNQHFTGITATLHNVVPHQLNSVNLAIYGPTLGLNEPQVTATDLLTGGRKPPKGKPFRIWHARRNTDLWRGIFYRDIAKLPLKILFTSAAQRRHSAVPRWLINQADAVIATTDLAAHFLKRTVAVIPHGIDLHTFHPPDNKEQLWQKIAKERGWPDQSGLIKIGQLGRIRPQKGTDLFVDALIALLPKHPNAIGVITGTAMPKEHNYKQRMMKKLAHAGLTDRVIWTGQLSFQALCQVQQSLDLFVAAARREEFGLTPAEALACGTPIICTDTGAFPMMVIEDKTGHLVPKENHQALVNAMADYLQNPEQLKSQAADCRAHAEAVFSAEREARAINAVYEQLWNQQG